MIPSSSPVLRLLREGFVSIDTFPAGPGSYSYEIRAPGVDVSGTFFFFTSPLMKHHRPTSLALYLLRTDGSNSLRRQPLPALPYRLRT